MVDQRPLDPLEIGPEHWVVWTERPGPGVRLLGLGQLAQHVVKGAQAQVEVGVRRGEMRGQAVALEKLRLS